jgi:hypothetical protein
MDRKRFWFPWRGWRKDTFYTFVAVSLFVPVALAVVPFPSSLIIIALMYAAGVVNNVILIACLLRTAWRVHVRRWRHTERMRTSTQSR